MPEPGITGSPAMVVPVRGVRRWRWLSAALRVVLVALAAWAIRRELAGFNLGVLFTELRGFGVPRVALAVAATMVSFLMLGGIELLALAYVRVERLVPRRTGLITAFVANALSQSIGVALLTGSTVRARAYRHYGVSGGDVARLSGFVTLTVTLGLMATGAAAFIETPEPLQLWHLALPMRFVGMGLAAAVAAYFLWSLSGRAGVVNRGAWHIDRPTFAVAIGQVGLASLDWVATGLLLFLLLPAALGMAFWPVLRVYLVAQTIGMASHVPGGAGVFDLLVLALLVPMAGVASRAALVGSLVAFRVLYYLIPLVLGTLVAVVAEARAPALIHEP